MDRRRSSSRRRRWVVGGLLQDSGQPLHPGVHMYSYATLRIRNVTYTYTYTLFLFLLAGAFPTHRYYPLSVPLPRTHCQRILMHFLGEGTVERAREKFMCNLRKIMIIFYFMVERTRQRTSFHVLLPRLRHIPTSWPLCPIIVGDK